MVLRRWDPFTELRQMQENMNHLWQSFSPTTDNGSEMERWSIPLDVCQEGDSMVVYASMPGVNPDDIDISIEDNVLTIRGQTKAEYEGHNGNYLMRERRTGSLCGRCPSFGSKAAASLAGGGGYSGRATPELHGSGG
jgi:HSP20 family protein